MLREKYLFLYDLRQFYTNMIKKNKIKNINFFLQIKIMYLEHKTVI